MIDFNTVKFLIIFACFINTLYIGKGVFNKKDILLLQLGMLFTLIADYFLIFTQLHIIGLISFCIVQIMYNLRYIGLKKTKIQIISALIIFTISYFILKINLLIAFGLMYCTLFIFTLISSFLAYKKYPKINYIFIIIGMILFALCDINVALYGLNIYSNNIKFSDTYLNTIFTLIWVFYLPSQILLSSTGRNYFK